MFNCCSHGTLLQLSVLKGSSLSICYYHQDLHRMDGSSGLTPEPSTHATGPLLLTAGRKLHEGSSCRSGRYRPNAGASSIFQELVASVVRLKKLRTFHKWKRGGSPVAPRPARETGIPNAADSAACTHFAAGLFPRPIDIAHMLDSLVRVSRRAEVYHPIKVHFQATRDSKEIEHRIEHSSYGPRTTPLGKTAQVKGTCCRVRLTARSLLNATFHHALASGGFGAGLLPVPSPLREGNHLLVFSFPSAYFYA
ncbi:hypothetical protein JTE90_010268 [Oedothorax gibbosus]|uniref:Uncharacterized protein n=1 Tax=Oedothorax gibbosus TaxID=931172 RepID=A0AAV6TDY4_9ARAC|nr:hypothetical protein JTE90_010268 [Oedothorax gibbosus]